jgi:large subunit ribosomal protein L15e
MGAYKYITETLQKQYKERDQSFRDKIMLWRSQAPIMAVDYPANLTRARRLGYKAKQGYIIVRARVDKGRRTRIKPMGGRKQKNFYRFVQPGMSHQAIAEQRVNRVYRNMEVLNSYWVGEDGNYKYFEVILADPAKATVNISSVIRAGKSFRGLTSAGNSGTPNKQKGWNKKLRRKLLRSKAFHYAPYVKSEKVAAPQRKAPLVAAPKVKRAKTAPAAAAAHASEHGHETAHEHSHEHAAHAPEHSHEPAEHAHEHSHEEHKHPHEQKKTS